MDRQAEEDVSRLQPAPALLGLSVPLLQRFHFRSFLMMSYSRISSHTDDRNGSVWASLSVINLCFKQHSKHLPVGHVFQSYE